MRDHDYLLENSHQYRTAVNSNSRTSAAAKDYRNKYLTLRKVFREFYKANPSVVPTEEIKKLIGLK